MTDVSTICADVNIKVKRVTFLSAHDIDSGYCLVQVTSFKVAEHSLRSCGSLTFMGVLFKTRCRYQAHAYLAQTNNIYMTFAGLKVRCESLPWQHG